MKIIKEKRTQSGNAITGLILFMVAVLLIGYIDWLSMLASSSEVQAEIKRDQPFPAGYSVLQSFLLVHPNPSNKDLMDIHQKIDKLRTRDFVAKATSKKIDNKGDELQVKQKTVANITPSANSANDKHINHVMSLILSGMIAIAVFSLTIQLIRLFLF